MRGPEVMRHYTIPFNRRRDNNRQYHLRIFTSIFRYLAIHRMCYANNFVPIERRPLYISLERSRESIRHQITWIESIAIAWLVLRKRENFSETNSYARINYMSHRSQLCMFIKSMFSHRHRSIRSNRSVWVEVPKKPQKHVDWRSLNPVASSWLVSQSKVDNRECVCGSTCDVTNHSSIFTWTNGHDSVQTHIIRNNKHKYRNDGQQRAETE